MPDSSLSDVTVLDLSDNVAGAYCGRLLAGFGADVVKVEAPGVGDWARGVGPFPDDLAHPEKSGLFLHLNAGKRSVVLDLEKAKGREVLKRLAPRAHVIIETSPPGMMASMGLGFDVLKEIESLAGDDIHNALRADGAVPEFHCDRLWRVRHERQDVRPRAVGQGTAALRA